MTDQKPKSFLNSKTIWFNAAVIAFWIVGLIVESANAGTLPEFLQPFAMIIVAVGNVILRFKTVEPIGFTDSDDDFNAFK